MKDSQGREIKPTENCIASRCAEKSLPKLDKCKKHWESEKRVDKWFNESGTNEMLKKIFKKEKVN